MRSSHEPQTVHSHTQTFIIPIALFLARVAENACRRESRVTRECTRGKSVRSWETGAKTNPATKQIKIRRVTKIMKMSVLHNLVIYFNPYSSYILLIKDTVLTQVLIDS